MNLPNERVYINPGRIPSALWHLPVKRYSPRKLPLLEQASTGQQREKVVILAPRELLELGVCAPREISAKDIALKLVFSGGHCTRFCFLLVEMREIKGGADFRNASADESEFASGCLREVEKHSRLFAEFQVLEYCGWA